MERRLAGSSDTAASACASSFPAEPAAVAMDFLALGVSTRRIFLPMGVAGCSLPPRETKLTKSSEDIDDSRTLAT